jgi:hypothetical protein
MRRVKDLAAARRPADAKLIHILSSGIKVRRRPPPSPGVECCVDRGHSLVHTAHTTL